jgi:hypothetical protein
LMVLLRTQYTVFGGHDGKTLAGRWKLEVGWTRGPFVSWQREWSERDDASGAFLVWKDGAQSLTVWLNRHWAWGGDHLWYDGELCSWSFGLLHFGRLRMPCKKCEAML